MGMTIKNSKSYLLAETDHKMQSLGIMFEIVAKKGADGGPQALALFYDRESAERILTFLEPYTLPEHIRTHPRFYVIRNVHDNLAWNSSLGWVEGEEFEVFNEMEMKNLNLPLDGYWQELPEK
jgi:hypothetical protein